MLHEGDPDRCVVLLPGARYPTRAPLLWFAREVAQQRGFSVLEVLEELPAGGVNPFQWAQERAQEALAGTTANNLVVIGKSLGSVAAGLVADRGLPAAWLTPVLDQEVVLEGLARASEPTLLVGGTNDSMWQPDRLPDNPALQIVELEGLDHGLQVEGDPFASLEALRRVTATVAEFLDGLEAA
jgi:predicted alpha/beta-hydrolase family hydrolase